MLYHPEVFIYLMLLPVACLVVLPAFFSTVRVVLGAVRNSKASELEESYSQEALAKA